MIDLALMLVAFYLDSNELCNFTGESLFSQFKTGYLFSFPLLKLLRIPLLIFICEIVQDVISFFLLIINFKTFNISSLLRDIEKSRIVKESFTKKNSLKRNKNESRESMQQKKPKKTGGQEIWKKKIKEHRNKGR